MEGVLMDEAAANKPLNGANGHSADGAVKPEHHLQAIMVKRNRFSYADKTLYRVYDKPDHFELVEANSAHEAFEKSGVKEAFKIQREMFYHYVAIDPELIETTNDIIEVDTELPSQEERQVLLDAALLGDVVEQDESTPFEAISLMEAFSAEAEDVVEASSEDVPVVEEEPEPDAAPTETEEEPTELSSDEVNALLNAQES